MQTLLLQLHLYMFRYICRFAADTFGNPFHLCVNKYLFVYHFISVTRFSYLQIASQATTFTSSWTARVEGGVRGSGVIGASAKDSWFKALASVLNVQPESLSAPQQSHRRTH